MKEKVFGFFEEALLAFPLKGKEVALWPSTPPCYEEALKERGAHVANGEWKLFDAFILMLQLKSLGDGDIEAMFFAKSFLKEGGLLYLSIPVGKEKKVEGSHRVYGEKRMKELFKGWRPVGYFGYRYEDLLEDPELIHEPVFVLKAR